MLALALVFSTCTAFNVAPSGFIGSTSAAVAKHQHVASVQQHSRTHFRAVRYAAPGEFPMPPLAVMLAEMPPCKSAAAGHFPNTPLCCSVASARYCSLRLHGSVYIFDNRVCPTPTSKCEDGHSQHNLSVRMIVPQSGHAMPQQYYYRGQYKKKAGPFIVRYVCQLQIRSNSSSVFRVALLGCPRTHIHTAI